MFATFGTFPVLSDKCETIERRPCCFCVFQGIVIDKCYRHGIDRTRYVGYEMVDILMDQKHSLRLEVYVGS